MPAVVDGAAVQAVTLSDHVSALGTSLGPLGRDVPKFDDAR